MKNKTLNELSNAKVGDIIETKKYKYFVLESHGNCKNSDIICCFYNNKKTCYNIECCSGDTSDSKHHMFKKEIKEKDLTN